MEVDIRNWQKGDVEELAYQANNINIFNNVLDQFPHPYTRDEAVNWIKYNLTINPPENMAIVVDGHVAGGIGSKKKEDVYRKTREIGYFLGESYWGKGITTLAVQKFIRYLFETFDINRIVAPVFDFNIASQRVLEKSGFRKEAIHKKSVIKNNRFCDEVVFAILREELDD